MQSNVNLLKHRELKWVDVSTFNQVKYARGSEHHLYGIHYLNSYNVGVMQVLPTADNFPKDMDVVIYKNAVYYTNNFSQKVQKLLSRSLSDEPQKFPREVHPDSIKSYLDSIFYTRLTDIGMAQAKKQLFALNLIRFHECPPLPTPQIVHNTVKEAEECAYAHFIKYYID